MSNIQEHQKVVANELIDVEKHTPSSTSVDVAESESLPLHRKPSWWKKLIALGVEERGITPVPVEERTDGRFINVFSLWFTLSITTLPFVSHSSQFSILFANKI